MRLTPISKTLLLLLAYACGAPVILAANQTYENQTVTSKNFCKEMSGTTTWSGTSTECVNYSHNSATYDGTHGTVEPGGALGMNTSKDANLTITGYGEVLFNNNTASNSKGNSQAAAIAMPGSNKHVLTITNNTDVIFQQNESTAYKNANGSAIRLESNAETEISGNVNVTFQNNVTTVTGTGANNVAYGSICVSGSTGSPASILNINNNTGGVLFKNNSAHSDKSNAKGGAVAISTEISSTNISGNNNVNFTANHVSVGTTGTSGQTQAAGGAIFEDSAAFSISGNTSVVFQGNYAKNQFDTDISTRGSKYSARGGAIYSAGVILNDETTRDDNVSALAIIGNTKVDFTGNYVEFTGTYSATNDNTGAYGSSGCPKVAGGAIFAENGIRIQGNDNVTFSGNYEKTAAGYRLRAIFATNSTYTNIANDKNDNYVILTPSYLSANSGGSMVFYDGITLNGNSSNGSSPIHLNSDFNGTAQTGKIVFSGRYTESLLKNIAGANVSETEINNSRRFELNGDAILYAGTLSIEDSAYMQADLLTVKAGATLAGVLTLTETPATATLSLGEAAVLHNSELASTIDADVILENEAGLLLSCGHISLNNHKLELGSDTSISISIAGNYTEGDSVLLFTDVQSVNFTNGDLASTYFSGENITDETTIHFDDGAVYLSGITLPVPEPSTATLSLLSILALASRRRRK